MYQPKTGAKCFCKRGVQRDNCANCEGTGMVIDFKAIREGEPAHKGTDETNKVSHTPTPWSVREVKYGKRTGVLEKEGLYIGEIWDNQTGPEVAMVNAAYIVKAVNQYEVLKASHEALVGFLKEIADLAKENTHSVQDGYAMIQEWAEKAISQAEKGESQ